MKGFIIISALLLTILQLKAQNHIDGFLHDLSIENFKLNSTLNDLKKDEILNKNLVFYDKNGDISSYQLFKINNVFITKTYGFEGARFYFKKDTLVRIEFSKFNDSDDKLFEKTYAQLKAKYGESHIRLSAKNKLYKSYEWRYKDDYLIAMPLKTSFMIIYGNKFEK